MDWFRAGAQIFSMILGLAMVSRQPDLLPQPEPVAKLVEPDACLSEIKAEPQVVSVTESTQKPTLRILSPTLTNNPTEVAPEIDVTKVSETPTVIPSPIAPTTIETSVTKTTETNINEAVNNYRTDQGLTRLIMNDRLCQAAEKRWQELANDFSHTGFEAAVSGLGYSQIAENIWSGTQSSTQQVIQSWQGSSSHHKNMTGNWQFGCGTLKDGKAVYIFMSQ